VLVRVSHIENLRSFGGFPLPWYLGRVPPGLDFVTSFESLRAFPFGQACLRILLPNLIFRGNMNPHRGYKNEIMANKLYPLPFI
jgi:hypothetical protein